MCERAALTPASVRPVFRTSNGLPAARAPAAARRNRAPSRKPSTYTQIASVAGSATMYSMKSQSSRSDWLPSETQWRKPMPSVAARS